MRENGPARDNLQFRGRRENGTNARACCGPWLLALYLKYVGAWWNRIAFTFPWRIGTQLPYRRKQIVLILADKEGGAHLEENEDPDYAWLLTSLPLSFAVSGLQVETPDLARFLTAQSGVEMLECLRRNFSPNEDVPLKC